MRSLRGACLFAASLSAAVSVSFAVPAGRAAAQEGSVPQASGSSAPTTDTAVRMRPSDAARADFAAGLEAAAEERWSDAERAFRRSYEGSGAPVALLNLAQCLRSLGRVVEARDAFARLVDHSGLGPEARDEARRGLEDARAQLAHVVLRGLADVGPGVQVRIDGVEAAAPILAGVVELELDPGTHALEVTAPERTAWRWQGVVEAGPNAPLDPALPLVPREASVWESPWLWLGVGVAVLAGTAAGVGLWASDEAQLDPRSPALVFRF